jgi:translation initiation factor IF-2
MVHRLMNIVELTSLRHHKSEVQELEKGTECGIVLSSLGDGQAPPPEPEVGDTLRCFITRVCHCYRYYCNCSHYYLYSYSYICDVVM